MSLQEALANNNNVIVLPDDGGGRHLPAAPLKWRYVGAQNRYMFMYALPSSQSTQQLANSRATQAEAMLGQELPTESCTYYGTVWVAERGGLSLASRIALLSLTSCGASATLK